MEEVPVRDWPRTSTPMGRVRVAEVLVVDMLKRAAGCCLVEVAGGMEEKAASESHS